jgi:hypothetical protein
MDLPYQTYEKITGKKWTGGNSPDIISMYQKYGIKDAPASAEANLALQKAMLAEKSGGNQIVQDTSALRAKDNITGTKIDEKANNMTVTGGTTGGTNNGAGGVSVNSTNGDITGADGKIYKQTAPAGYTYNLPPLSDGKKYVYDASGKPMVQDTTGAITNDPYADQEYEKNRDAITKTNDYNAVFDSYKAGLDATHTALIDSIKEQSAIQRKKMEELNARSLGAKTVQGARTGSAEYTPEIDTGILKKEEEEGMARLAEIDSNMKLAIAQAMSAKTNKDFELATKRLEIANDLQKAKEETIQNIYKSYVDNAKMISDKLKAKETEDRASKDQALQELAVSAPELTKQYDSLKTDADRKLWLSIMVKKTGLDETILKGALEKTRLDVANKVDIMENRGAGGSGATAKKKQQDDDIASAILDFQDQIKNKGWAGINPQAYEYYKKEIKRIYGPSAVLDFDKAIKDAKLTVDNGEGV